MADDLDARTALMILLYWWGRFYLAPPAWVLAHPAWSEIMTQVGERRVFSAARPLIEQMEQMEREG